MKNKIKSFNITLSDEGLIKNIKTYKDGNGMTWDDTLSLLIGQSHSMRWNALDLEAKRMVAWAEVLFQDRPDVVQAISSSLAILLNPRVHDTPHCMERLCRDLDVMHRVLLQDVLPLGPVPKEDLAPPPRTPPPDPHPRSGASRTPKNDR